MPRFSRASRAQLDTCDSRLQRVMEEVIQIYDFTVVQGHRSLAEQMRYYQLGTSRVRKGKHNAHPSLAVDIAPYPIDWSNDEDAIRRFVYLAGHVMATAARMGIPLRWGGDWDRDQDIRDEKGKLRDWGHFELVG